MANSRKQELDMDTLAEAVGGAEQNNKNKKGVQLSAQNGNNINDNIQTNNVHGNKGNVKIGGPVTIKHIGGGNTINIG